MAPRSLARRFVLALAVALTACARAPKAEPVYGTSLKYGPACSEARAQARMADSLPGLVRPRAVRLFMPPFPVPAQVKGHVAEIALRVDSAGFPVAETVQIYGITDRAYIVRMRAALAATRYQPASLDGCAVEGATRLTFDFAR